MNEIHVVGAAIVEGNKVLAAQRSERMGNPFKWEFPGGKVEPGESQEEALIRELLEEMDIKIEVGDYITSGEAMTKDGKRIKLHVYLAKILEGVPVPKEHEALLWTDIHKIDRLDWAEADIPACKRLAELYKRPRE